MVAMAFLTGALTVGAVAVATASFKDSSVSCGAPIGSALHGKSATIISADGKTSSVLALTKEQAKIASQPVFGLRASGQVGDSPSNVFVVCRRPARGRLLLAVVSLAAAILGVVFVARRSDRATPIRQEPAAVAA